MTLTWQQRTSDPSNTPSTHELVLYGGRFLRLGPRLWTEGELQITNTFSIEAIEPLQYCAYTQSCPSGTTCTGLICEPDPQ